MKTKQKRVIEIKKRREYTKPTIHELNVNQTKGGPTSSNNENKNHFS